MKHVKIWLPVAVFLTCLLALGLLVHGDASMTGHLTAQNAAKRWQTTEKPCAMASVFLSPGQAIPDAKLGEVYVGLDKALTTAGAGDQRWYLAASGRQDAVLRSGDRSVKTELFAVRGDFFQAHSMTLRAGAYPQDGDVMHDRIVLDRETAWVLFYGDNVAGQYVELNGVTLQVAGVVDREPGRDNALVRENTCWVLWDCPALEAPPGYTCLEAVLPQPVSGFAAGALTTALGSMLPEGATVTDNDRRFSLKNRIYVLRHLAQRSVGDGELGYPYWENAARITENRLALRLIPEAILAALLLLLLAIQLLWWNHRRTWGLRSLRRLFEDAVERKRRRDWDRTHGGT